MMAQIDKEKTAVDVGANIGYYTLLLAKRAKKVYAFEPDKNCFEILCKNVEANGFKNVILINKAVGEKSKKIGLKQNKENFGDSRVAEGKTTECVKLDDIIREKVDLIKIDVQGYEPQVIEGTKKIITKNRPVLFLEYTPGEYKDNKMIRFLDKNYKNVWSINDFAEVPWPIHKGIKVLGKVGYADLWMKRKMVLKDYLTILKNVKYKKWIKGIINLYG